MKSILKKLEYFAGFVFHVIIGLFIIFIFVYIVYDRNLVKDSIKFNSLKKNESKGHILIINKNHPSFQTLKLQTKKTNVLQ